ncbi:MAG: PQQ-dependent sugar dehydrogenase [Pseudomonadota bacterium]|nr:PQQ-dependent sugar dehydrogenase [Pseudomonadota bacterium]
MLLWLLALGCDGGPDKPDKPAVAPAEIGSVALSPTSPQTNDVLTATVVGATGDLAFAWFVDGTVVGETSASLTGISFHKGQTVYVEVTASKEGTASVSAASAAVTVVNTLPTAPLVDLSLTRDGLECSILALSEDADADPVTYTSTITSDVGTTIEELIVPLSRTAMGSAWTCALTPNDGESVGPAGTSSITLEGPLEGGYSFERVADVLMPADIEAVADGTLLVATLLGELSHVDPASGAVLGTVTLYNPDDLVSLALDPRFGDGTHDWLYTWTNHTCVIARHALTLEPFAVTATEELMQMDCPLLGGHAGGDLLFWQGESAEPLLYLGIGPTIDGNPQEEVQPGQKLLAFAIGEDGTLSPGLDAGFENPYIVAKGLRNPWRLADCGSGICVADAGSDFYEEVNLYTGAGMNFGYPRAEGPDEAGIFDDPFLWWENEDSAFPLEDRDGPGRTGIENTPMIGVRVSGRAFAGRLDGVLLYADVFDGWVRGAALDDTGVLLDDVPLAFLPYVLAMTEAPDGSVYAVSLAGGVWRLGYRAERTRIGDAGARLSDAAPGGIPYEVRYPLWSNGAEKQRWLELPVGTAIDTTDPEAWVYPEGTRLWKRFTMDGLPVETRLLEKRDGAWIGATYVWSGDDAYLTDGTRQDLILPSGEPYTVPSQYACAVCHEATSGQDAPLGVEPFQLGDEGLAAIAEALDAPYGPAPELDIADPVEAEVRGYLHGNCAFCHQPAGVVSMVSVVTLDFRYSALDTGLLDAHAEYWNANPYENDGLPLVAPGDPDGSALVGILEATDMPRLSVWEPDVEAIATIRTWIAAMPASP